MKLAARIPLLVIPLTLGPQFSFVGFGDAPSDGQPQPRPSPLEISLAGGVQGQFTRLVKFFKDQFVKIGVDADAGIGDDDFDPRSPRFGFGHRLA